MGWSGGLRLSFYFHFFREVWGDFGVKAYCYCVTKNTESLMSSHVTAFIFSENAFFVFGPRPKNRRKTENFVERLMFVPMLQIFRHRVVSLKQLGRSEVVLSLEQSSCSVLNLEIVCTPVPSSLLVFPDGQKKSGGNTFKYEFINCYLYCRSPLVCIKIAKPPFSKKY